MKLDSSNFKLSASPEFKTGLRNSSILEPCWVTLSRHMKTLKVSRALGAMPVVVMAWSMAVAGQAPQALTEKDKSEIQALVTGYAKALGSCAATEYVTAQGYWRFKSRVYVAEGAAGAQ